MSAPMADISLWKSVELIWEEVIVKRWISLLTAVVLALPLAACGNAANADPASSGNPLQESAQSAAISAEVPAREPDAETADSSQVQAPEEEPETAGGTLIAYFSWSGNTEQMAQFIQAETGGDLFQITPATPYTDDYNALLDIAQQEQGEDARPELAAQVENWDSYDVVFVGYPDWWSDAPMPVYSFLESYDWAGKTLVPFCTSGGSGFGRSLDRLPHSAPGATILEGLHINGDHVDGAAGEVAGWIDGLGL